MGLLAQAGLYENPDPWTYVGAGYALCIIGVVAYSLTLLRRGRRLARQVPPGERRWLDAPGDDAEGGAG
jgi:hypothetical protein